MNFSGKINRRKKYLNLLYQLQHPALAVLYFTRPGEGIHSNLIVCEREPVYNGR